MRSVALLLSCSLTTSLLGGCFPHNSRHRTYAQLTEGGSLVAGIAILSLTTTGADCDVAGMDADCRTSASVVGNIGLGLIIAGLVGFIATVSTAEDDKPATTPPPDPTPTPVPMQQARPAAPVPMQQATDAPATPPPPAQ